MAWPQRDMRDVVFGEVESDVGPNGGPTDTAAPSGGDPSNAGTVRRNVARLRSRWWWAVAAGLILVVVANSVVTGRRESARLAALAEIPRVLAPLSGPVAELWHVDGAQYSGFAVLAGRLLVAERRPDGKVAVVALDPRTGHEAWRTAARPASAGAGATADLYENQCAFPESTRPDLGSIPRVVACVVADETTTSNSALGEQTYPTKAHLLVINATTGTVLSDEPTDPSSQVAQLGTDLVMTRIDHDGRVRVARTDALGMGTRWAFTSPDPVSKDPFGHRSARLWASEGLVGVSTGYDLVGDTDQLTAGSSWLLSGGGHVMDTQSTGPSTRFAQGIGVLPGGRLLIKSTASTADARTMTVTDRTTGRSFTAAGAPVAADSDDGSLTDLALTCAPTSDKLTAYDIASGKPIWTSGGAVPGGGQLLILDGRIIRSGDSTLTSIDGRTGNTVWTTATKQSDGDSLVTDGRLVVRAQSTHSGGTVLTAYGVDDGLPRWQTHIADDLSIFVIGRRLYGWSGRGGLVALG